MEASGQLHGQVHSVSTAEKTGWAPEMIQTLWGNENPILTTGNRSPILVLVRVPLA
jgi:hypothetical protein